MKKKPTEQLTNLMQNEQRLASVQTKHGSSKTMLLTVWKEEHLFTMILLAGSFSRLQERPITNSRPGCGHRGVASMRGSYIEKGGYDDKYSGSQASMGNLLLCDNYLNMGERVHQALSFLPSPSVSIATETPRLFWDL